MDTFNGVMTGVLIILFLGICAWAYSSRNKKKFEEMANLPLEDQPQNSEFDHDE